MLPLLVAIVITHMAGERALDNDPNLPHITGTFQFTGQTCSTNRGRGSTCHWYGDFTSDDGSVVRTGMRWVGAADSESARRVVPAVDVGVPDVIYSPPGPNPGDSWRPIVWIALAGAAGIASLWWYPVRAVRRLARRYEDSHGRTRIGEPPAARVGRQKTTNRRRRPRTSRRRWHRTHR